MSEAKPNPSFMELEKDLKSFLKTAQKPLLVILGPTASGKTNLSLTLARKFKGEILSTDSRQIYKGMEIGTAAALPEEQNGIPHHLLSIATPDKTINLADYNDMALKAIKEIHKRKGLPMLVGGTGLYISSIIEGYEVPRVPPNEKLRAKLFKEAQAKGNEYLHKKLAKLDPEAAKNIHPNNVRYVIRALEINAAGQNKEDKKKKKSAFEVLIIGIKWPRQKLYDRINARVDAQIKKGLLDEVKALLAKYPENLPSMSSLGVKELIPHVKGKMPLAACLEILKRNTRRYAKRQMTWFRRYNNVNWINHGDVERYLGTSPTKMAAIPVSKKTAPKKVMAKPTKSPKKAIKKIAKKPVKKATKSPKKSIKKITKKLVKKATKPPKKATKPVKPTQKKKLTKKRK